jgi:hypothetical protein
MVSVLPTSLTLSGVINYLVYGMVAVGGFYLFNYTLAPSLTELVEKEA